MCPAVRSKLWQRGRKLSAVHSWLHHREDLLRGEDVVEEVAVGEHDPLGVAGGARGVDEGGEVVLREGGRLAAHGVAVGGEGLPALRPQLVERGGAGDGVGVEADDVLQPREAGAHLGDLRRLGRVRDEHDLRLRVVEDVEHLRRGQRRVDRRVRRSGAQGGEVGEGPLRPVLGDDGDLVAAGDPEGPQAHRDLLDRGPELLRADRAPRAVPLVLQVLRLAVGVDRTIEEVADGLDGHARLPARRSRVARSYPGRSRGEPRG